MFPLFSLFFLNPIAHYFVLIHLFQLCLLKTYFNVKHKADKCCSYLLFMLMLFFDRVLVGQRESSLHHGLLATIPLKHHYRLEISLKALYLTQLMRYVYFALCNNLVICYNARLHFLSNHSKDLAVNSFHWEVFFSRK